MAVALYQRDTIGAIHRGAICAYCPIFWLEPPLWLLRNIDWNPPRHADLYRWDERSDAFRGEHVEEEVVASAKVRYLVILSNDHEIQKFTTLLVAPTYTTDPDRHSTFLDRLRRNEIPHLFHLGEDPGYPEMRECYIDFRKIQLLHKDFLTEDSKSGISLTDKALSALLERYRRYLLIA